MTGWLIFAGIVVFILGVLMIPVHIAADYKENLSLNIRFLFFFKMKILPSEEKAEKKEKKPKQSKKANAEEKPKKEKRKMTAEEIIDMIIDSVKKYGPGARIILKNIRFHRIELFWRVCAEDAAACGIKYGKVCAWLSGVLGFFRNLTKIEHTKMRVFPYFIGEKDEIYGGADIEFNPLVIIYGALRIAAVFIKETVKNQNGKTKKAVPKAQTNIKTKESV